MSVLTLTRIAWLPDTSMSIPCFS